MICSLLIKWDWAVEEADIQATLGRSPRDVTAARGAELAAKAAANWVWRLWDARNAIT
jgi:creatinine amidohydrolase/Fe(II)-dependent formamide hydrolase-like protein